MSDEGGDKTEQATPKKLQEAFNQGQFARSAEIQTACVLLATATALSSAGPMIWRTMAGSMSSLLAHLHDTPVTANAMQGYIITSVGVLGRCVWPLLLTTLLTGVLAGGVQTRFRFTTEVLGLHWGRLNPAAGFKRVFSMQSVVPTGVGLLKLTVVGVLTYSVVRDVLNDPIFYTTVDMARIAEFMADSSRKILVRVGLALVVLASADYGYQYWKIHRDLMMTKEEVKDEAKSSEGNPQIKTAIRRRRVALSKRKMLMEVPKADVIVVNPTHIAVALRYDRKTMKAPKIVAKGSRLNALRIREIAQQHQVPIVENKPLARLMFKYGRVGGEIPAQLYAAVAEILAWVYRVNAYRYYREQSM